MNIQFLGAAKVVTGSCFLVTTEKNKLLIDCGLFQGREELEKLNYEDFSFNPTDIDFVLLTHAHIDHSGRIPKLVKDGFKGKVICTKATSELCDVMLLDSAHIQESDSEWENKKRKRSGKPLVEPLYTKEDAELSLRYFNSVIYNQKIDLSDNITVKFSDAGHILGSSIIELWITESGDTIKLVFSGDLGSNNSTILNNSAIIEDADYLIIESTYGDKLHADIKTRANTLIDIINTTVKRNGTVIIPSFAVQRTQELIYELNNYYEYEESLETFMKIPIYIDSPMAVSTTDIFKNNAHCFNENTKKLVLSGDNPFEFENLHYVRSQNESIKLNSYTFPKVIISASGMCTGGRVRHHLKHNLWKKRNSIIFVGYQAEGTLGRLIRDGSKKVHVLGEKIAVEAEIHSIESFSSHADQNDLINWIKEFKTPPKTIFIVHGEKKSSQTLSSLIEKTLKIKTIIPEFGYEFNLKNDMFAEHFEKFNNQTTAKENLTKELDSVRNKFENFSSKANILSDNTLDEKEYNNMKNKLLELEEKLMDLNMFLSK